MKKTLVFFLVLIMSLGSLTGAFAASGQFEDVKTSDWFYNDVKTAVELGLVNGRNETIYDPNANLTYAEAIKLAACMNQLYTIGSINIENGNPWYMPYVDYCKKNRIITKEYTYTEQVTRAGYMEIFAKALPDEALEAINTVTDNSIPDVPSSATYAPGVYKLYRAGILQGMDAEHNCSPKSNIRRCEVATILTRMMDKSKRVKFTLGVEPLEFTKDPIGGEIEVGGTITTNIEVTGGVAPYTYQWMYNDGSGWKKVTSDLGTVKGETTNKISIKAAEGASYKIRCVVKDAKGNEATSKSTDFIFKAKNNLRIVEQPESVTTEAGKAAKVSVKVAGGAEPYKYLWACDAGTTWYSLANAMGCTGGDTDTLTYVPSAANEMIVACTITDAKGASVTTKEVEIIAVAAKEEAKPVTPTEPLVITKQPENTNVEVGKTAVIEVEAAGGAPEYTYQWYYQGGQTWGKLTDGAGVEGATSNKLIISKEGSFIVNLRCEVKDAAGNKVISKQAELFVGKKILPLEIVTQPVDTTVTVGTDAVVSVKAQNGAEPYTYQWQMNIGTGWVRMNDAATISGTTTDTLTLKSAAASDIQVRCVVKDSAGLAVESNGIKVTFK